jgi:hypothetical protein
MQIQVTRNVLSEHVTHDLYGMATYMEKTNAGAQSAAEMPRRATQMRAAHSTNKTTNYSNSNNFSLSCYALAHACRTTATQEDERTCSFVASLGSFACISCCAQRAVEINTRPFEQ